MLFPVLGEMFELAERRSAEFTKVRRLAHSEVLQQMLNKVLPALELLPTRVAVPLFGSHGHDRLLSGAVAEAR